MQWILKVLQADLLKLIEEDGENLFCLQFEVSKSNRLIAFNKKIFTVLFHLKILIIILIDIFQ